MQICGHLQTVPNVLVPHVSSLHGMVEKGLPITSPTFLLDADFGFGDDIAACVDDSRIRVSDCDTRTRE